MAKKRKKKVTLNVQIPIALHEQFKAYAKTQGEPMRFFVQQDIKARLPNLANQEMSALSIAVDLKRRMEERQEYKERQRDNCVVGDFDKL